MSVQFPIRTCDHEVVDLTPSCSNSLNDSGQVVHTCMPLSSSDVLWYQPNDDDAMWLRSEKATVGLAFHWLCIIDRRRLIAIPAVVKILLSPDQENSRVQK